MKGDWEKEKSGSPVISPACWAGSDAPSGLGRGSLLRVIWCWDGCEMCWGAPARSHRSAAGAPGAGGTQRRTPSVVGEDGHPAGRVLKKLCSSPSSLKTCLPRDCLSLT